ncbi:hypothetical protein NMG60_11001138 [Bertholletia excelsa]
MGRPPCCDKVGVKKGPWTPEEDIILVTYIQEHGPGNWRSVPTNTGLLRCSKSCRLRWTNYLRPGIKRGNFTPHEEGLIIHLQALLGNKWAAIASYLPQRTDNDIKNYWNTHLKKKMKKLQSSLDPQTVSNSATYQLVSSKSLSDALRSTTSSDHMTSPSIISSHASNLNQVVASSSYASSTENISRLLEGWMRSSPKSTNNHDTNNNASSFNTSTQDKLVPVHQSNSSNIVCCAATDHLLPSHHRQSKSGQEGSHLGPNEELESLENWLLGETNATQVEEMMELPPIF